MKILALDFEGTSKDPRMGYPAQIGVAVMDGDEVLAQDEWLHLQPVHYKTGAPTKVVDANSLRIWGMTLDRLDQEGITIREGCDRLARFVEDNAAQWLPIVSYNITYDVESYGAMLFEAGYYDRSLYKYLPYHEVLGPRWVCAYRMARLKLPHLAGHKLDDVADHFGLARDTLTHGALMDAILGGKVYNRLAASMKAEQGERVGAV